jgi:hypothetical protein
MPTLRSTAAIRAGVVSSSNQDHALVERQVESQPSAASVSAAS